MANRRMFSLDVINTDDFMEMPLSAQALYFHLGMRADDDGFISSPRQIMKAVECKQDDMKVLVAKGFVIPFTNGVVVIRHWNQNNYIRSDRYKKTVYLEEKQMLVLENDVYHMTQNGIPTVSNLATQVRIGKDSIDKDNKKTVGPEPEEPAPNPSGILLPLNDKTYYDVPLDKITLWKETYPAVDVEQELKRMIAWLDSNPTRRKTRRGITKFINTWLSREQDEGGRFKGSRQQGQELTPQDYELPEEYREMYKKHLGKKPPSPDDPFQ